MWATFHFEYFIMGTHRTGWGAPTYPEVQEGTRFYENKN